MVYNVGLQPLTSSEQTRVDVKMTLTAQGCPMSGQILAEVQRKLLELDGIGEANIEIVFDPPWSSSRINEEGRKRLGLC